MSTSHQQRTEGRILSRLCHTVLFLLKQSITGRSLAIDNTSAFFRPKIIYVPLTSYSGWLWSHLQFYFIMNLQHKIRLPICRDNWECLHSRRNFCSSSHEWSWKDFHSGSSKDFHLSSWNGCSCRDFHSGFQRGSRKDLHSGSQKGSRRDFHSGLRTGSQRDFCLGSSSCPHRLTRWSLLLSYLSSSLPPVDVDIASYRHHHLARLSLSLSSSPPLVNVARQRWPHILPPPPQQTIFVIVVIPIPVPVPAACQHRISTLHPLAATALRDLHCRHRSCSCPCPRCLSTSCVDDASSCRHCLARSLLLSSSPPPVDIDVDVASSHHHCLVQSLSLSLSPPPVDVDVTSANNGG